MKKIILILSILVLWFKIGVGQQFSDAQIKTALINKFVQNLQWENESALESFTMAVYGPDTTLVSFFKALAAGRTLKDKEIKVKTISDFSKLKSPYPQLIYISNAQNYEIEDILNKLKNENVLIVTDDCKEQQFVMINFTYKEDKSINFEINRKTIEEQNLTILPKLLLLGGTDIDVRELYNKKDEELKTEKIKVEQQKAELEQQKVLLAEQNAAIIKKQDEIAKQQLMIETQQLEILKQKDTLSRVLIEVNKQESRLREQLTQMDKQKSDIAAQQKLIDKQNEEVTARNKVLDDLNKEIENQQNKINTQENTLGLKELEIGAQKRRMLILMGVIGLIAILIVIIIIGYIKKQKINKQLNEKNIAIQSKNVEIENQKEELKSQAEELIKINGELEKLSIVASKTDNAVVIMDYDANFEWVNDGFIRLYGYDLEHLKENYGTNLKSSNKKNIDEVIYNCITNKRTQIYENLVSKSNGESKWVQTTLTPIVDEVGHVRKLVAIDSDISKLKDAEFEINQKNEELVAQRDELEAQKDYITVQNVHIKSSINYAKTIQTAILPLSEDLDKYFENFVIFKPKDIVSGDFYWFTNILYKQKEYNFVAVVDCTGHGVPGAFMSMIASRLLNEIVLESKVLSPKDILTNVDAAVRKALRQDKTDNDDGMDICLCRFENNEDKIMITYTGAKRPLNYYKREKNVMEFLKADRRSIGGYVTRKNKVEFTNQELEVTKGDMLYMSTDGYVDQSGPERRRFGTVAYVELLDKIKEENLQTQKEKLVSELAKWQGTNDQRDDITVIGLKIK